MTAARLRETHAAEMPTRGRDVWPWVAGDAGSQDGGGEMRARELMRRRVFTTWPTESLADVADRMRDTGVGCLVVMASDRRMLGIVTDRDLLCAMAEGRVPRVTPVSEVMTAAPVGIEPDEELRTAAQLMVRLGIRHLPVVEGDVAIGMLSARDLLIAEPS
jgi:CBS domain-containing protein